MISDLAYRSFREVQRSKALQVISEVPPEPPVLDVGSGFGFIPNALRVDVNPDYVRRTGGIVADASFLPLKDGSFRTVYCLDAIHLIPNGVNEIRRVLARGGKAVFSLPCSRYNSAEVMSRLTSLVGSGIIKKFYCVGKEMSAVVVVRKL
ncbi:MAG: class I SAM-dependent methyltransferase [Candidatus Micrarchaeota archaeon]|nr:class I SAM-dependent methyltransferase [Candidatus Micrarchaeota archaeon]